MTEYEKSVSLSLDYMGCFIFVIMICVLFFTTKACAVDAKQFLVGVKISDEKAIDETEGEKR